jgi:subtilase family serine protease
MNSLFFRFVNSLWTLRAAALTMTIALAAAISVPGIAAAGSLRPAGNHPAQAAAIATGAQVAPDLVLHMRITLKLRDRAGLKRLLAAQQDPSSAQYHDWLTPDEFNARFGPTGADARKVKQWLKDSGFTVDAISAGNRYVEFHSSAANAERAFAVHIGVTADGRYFANREDPALAADIAPLVGAISGLANTGHAMLMVTGGALTRVSPDVRIGKIKHRFGPSDFYAFYDYTPLQEVGIDGTGADCLALIEDVPFGDLDAGPDVDTFDSEFGLPAANLSGVEVDPTNPATFFGSEIVEMEEDVEYAHAAAPGAQLVLYLGNPAVNSLGNTDGGWVDALNRAVSDNTCGAISIAHAFCGEPNAFYTSTLDGLFAQAASQGQAVFVSAGDWGAAGITVGSGGCEFAKTRGVSELAADPNVTAVGGTQFHPKYSKAGDDIGSRRERVWHDRLGASSGGESALFAKPPYQSGVIPEDSNRDIPDVSFAAGPLHPGLFMVLNGDETVCCIDGVVGAYIGGTSLGAPYWAGIDELVAQEAGEARTGNLNARLYALGALGDPATSGLRDVTRGNNSFHGVKGFKATAGYDKATGWGTPDIGILVPALAAGP